jgi:hypothetical protein
MTSPNPTQIEVRLLARRRCRRQQAIAALRRRARPRIGWTAIDSSSLADWPWSVLEMGLCAAFSSRPPASCSSPREWYGAPPWHFPIAPRSAAPVSIIAAAARPMRAAPAPAPAAARSPFAGTFRRRAALAIKVSAPTILGPATMRVRPWPRSRLPSPRMPRCAPGDVAWGSRPASVSGVATRPGSIAASSRAPGRPGRCSRHVLDWGRMAVQAAGPCRGGCRDRS